MTDHGKLFPGEAEAEHRPAAHAGAAVCPRLDVEFASEKARVELHAPVVVVEEGARGSGVGRGGEDVALETFFKVIFW